MRSCNKPAVPGNSPWAIAWFKLPLLWPHLICFIITYQTCFINITFLIIQKTFVRAKSWVKELQRQANPNIVIALAGNKADLEAKRTVEFEVGFI